MEPRIFNPLIFPSKLTVTDQPCYKRKFSRREAKAALHDITRSRELGNFYRGEQQVYQCPACGWWHLTSQEKDERHEV